jgi:plastocyanin
MTGFRTSPSIRTLAAVVAAVALAVATLVLSPGARAGTNHAVQITGFAFAPAALTVTVGDTVTWTNLDPVIHTATSTSGAFDSGDLVQNESFSLTFTAPGTYAYLCTPHPDMTGTVTVVAAPTVAPVATAAPGGGLPNVAMPEPTPAPVGRLALGIVLVVVGTLVAARRVEHREIVG